MSKENAVVKSGAVGGRSPVISDALLDHYLDRGRALQAQALRQGLVAAGLWLATLVTRHPRTEILGNEGQGEGQRSPAPDAA
ncbi:MAG: RSP_7527 family protein [Candidatus Competibacterales bacterium]